MLLFHRASLPLFHTVCALDCLSYWMKRDGQPDLKAHQFSSLDLPLKVWGTVTLWLTWESVLPASAVVIKTQMWMLSHCSLVVLSAFQPRRKVQSKGWPNTCGAVCRKALDVWQGMSVDCSRLRRVCSWSLFFLMRVHYSSAIIGNVGVNPFF